MKNSTHKCFTSVWGILATLAAVVLFFQIILALTGPPQCLVNWLEMPEIAPRQTPRNIVVLGGGVMPSGSTLLRIYYAAQYGKNLTGTTFIVALPTGTDPETSSVGRMRDELELRGIPSSAIRMEHHGLDTYEQAVNIQHMLGTEALNQSILIVTSGYHMRRSVACFRKLGFTSVAGLLASEIGADTEIGPWGWLRYQVWGNMEQEINILRELTALAAYKLRNRI